jgi:hypothetical protein
MARSPRRHQKRRSPASRDATKRRTAFGIGDPVTDMVVNVSNEELLMFAQEPGGCDTMDSDTLSCILDTLTKLGKAVQRVPGGSAANVMRCLAMLSADTRVSCALGLMRCACKACLHLCSYSDMLVFCVFSGPKRHSKCA